MTNTTTVATTFINRVVTIKDKQYLVVGSPESSYTVSVKLSGWRGGYRPTTSQRLHNLAIIVAKEEIAREALAAEQAAEAAAKAQAAHMVLASLEPVITDAADAAEQADNQGIEFTPVSFIDGAHAQDDNGLWHPFAALAPAAEPELPTTAAGVIANFEAQIVDLRAALATASPDAWVLEIQGLYVRVDSATGKADACGVLRADKLTQYEAVYRAPNCRNGNGIAATPRSLPEAIGLSIMGLETCIASIRSVAA